MVGEKKNNSRHFPFELTKLSLSKEEEGSFHNMQSYHRLVAVIEAKGSTEFRLFVGLKVSSF